MNEKNLTEQWAGLSGLYRKCSLAGIILIALSTLSCSSTKRLSESSQVVVDSVVIREVREIIPVTIPESKAVLAIPMENLRSLPPEASFTNKSGQATVKAEYKPPDEPGEPEVIIITATCDSLQVMTERLQRELTRARYEAEATFSELRKDGRNLFLFGLAAGIFITAVVFIIIIVKRK